MLIDAVDFAVIDLDDDPGAGSAVNVTSVPDTYVYVDGTPVDHFVGSMTFEDVEEWLARPLPFTVPWNHRCANSSVIGRPQRLMQFPTSPPRMLPRVDASATTHPASAGYVNTTGFSGRT